MADKSGAGRTVSKSAGGDVSPARKTAGATSRSKAGNDNAHSPINNLIQKEVIPRLLMSHSIDGARTDFFQGRRAKEAEAKKFAELPLTNEADFMLAEVERLRRAGVSTESIFVDLLAASARRLGQMWEDDECDFVEVTLGIWRLQEVMRDCALRSIAESESKGAPSSALFSPMPGDQHNFGALMLEEVFANAGWQTEVLLEPNRHELLHLLAERIFHVVGLTISCDYPSQKISELITAIRSVSKNPEVHVLIGGRFVNGDKTIAVKTGADGTAPDARSALALANSLVAQTELVGTPVT